MKGERHTTFQCWNLPKCGFECGFTKADILERQLAYYCGLYVMCRTTGKPLLQVKWGPEKDRLGMEGVGFGVAGPHSGALTVRRGDRGAVWWRNVSLVMCARSGRRVICSPVCRAATSVPRVLRWGLCSPLCAKPVERSAGRARCFSTAVCARWTAGWCIDL
jgi:hypothetical protein